MRKRNPEKELKRKIFLLKKAGIKETEKVSINDTEPLTERIKKILKIVDNQKTTQMLFFVMYDIENDKVRKEIAKYLIKKGCVRVQKSVYFASLPHNVYKEIYQTIKEVQEIYQNHDSVFFIPVSTDEVRNMKIIGQNIDFDLIIGNKNTYFF